LKLGTTVVVPVRALESTKARLAPLLSGQQRGLLSSALLRWILRGVERSRAEECVVVSSKPEELQELLSNFSKARAISERRINGGVSAAMRDGIRSMRAAGRSIVLIPSDLPLLTASSIDGVIEFLASWDVLIGPSRKMDGTSLLAFSDRSHLIKLRYDEESYRNHLVEIQRAQASYLELRSEEISQDLDDEGDLRTVLRLLGGITFTELIRRLAEE
jgi:2-phospho-L-lactate guanylyltransferase